MYTQQVTVTIGRNVGNAPMSPNDWARFGARVEGVLIGALGVELGDIERHDGRGVWDGVEEDSAKFSVLVPDFDADKYAALKYRLRIIADDFEQDAIALSVGVSELV